MTGAHWMLVMILALAAFAIRVIGLVAGDRIRVSRHAWMLEDLPGLILVGLIAASLAGEPAPTWVAAAIALGAAVLSNHVIVTMCIGVAAYAGFGMLGV